MYFALTYTGKTLVITAPSGNDEQKKFLGYEFSTRRGEEGMTESDGSLTNLHNRNDTGKLAWFVKQAFDGVECSSPEYGEYVSYIRTADMLDFSRPSFDLQLKLTADKTVQIQSKYPLVKLGEYLRVEDGYAFASKNMINTNTPEYLPVIKIANIGADNKLKLNNIQYHKKDISLTKYEIQKGDILISLTGGKVGNGAVGKVVVSDKNNLYLNQRVGMIKAIKEDLMRGYVENILKTHTFRAYCIEKAHGSSQVNMSSMDIENFLIPLPPFDIQQHIVAECEKVDEEYNTAQKTIEENKRKIEEAFERLDGRAQQENGIKLRLSDTSIFDISIGRRVLNSEVNPGYTIPVYSANVFEPFGMIDTLLIEDFSVPSILWGIDGDWMVNTIEANTPFYPTDHCGVLRLKTEHVLPKYMAHLLKKAGEKAGFKRSYRASIDRIKSLTVQAAPIEDQILALQKIETYEAAITAAKSVLSACAGKKKMILEKWL